MKLFTFLATNRAEVLRLTLEHAGLVLVSTSIAIALGVPLGIVAARKPVAGRWIIGFANLMQTIPSLALFGFLIPIPFIGGIGARTAIVALVLYALLPIVRGTHAGLGAVDRAVREAAIAMGMDPWQRLSQVELPLAFGVILSGIRVATVICVGVATIAAAIGAGGLGVYIFRGVAMVDDRLILAGAVPAAAMAISADFALGALARRFGASSAPRHVAFDRDP
jgi:osmoprotectant transport system permease protein